MAGIPPELEAAYRVFLEELKKHFGVLTQISAEFHAPGQTARSAEETEKIRRSLQHKFHTIRGGAGFFQLDSIVSIAAEGETLFASLAGKDLILKALGEKLPVLVERLREESEKILDTK